MPSSRLHSCKHPVLVGTPEELQAVNGLMDSTRRLAPRHRPPASPGPLGCRRLALPTSSPIDCAQLRGLGRGIFAIGPRLPLERAKSSLEVARRGVVDDVVEGNAALAGTSPWPGRSRLSPRERELGRGFQVGAVLFASRTLSTSISGYGFLIGCTASETWPGTSSSRNLHISGVTNDLLASWSSARGSSCWRRLLRSLWHARAALAAVGGPWASSRSWRSCRRSSPPIRQGGSQSALHDRPRRVAVGLVLARRSSRSRPCAWGSRAGGARPRRATGLTRFGLRRDQVL